MTSNLAWILVLATVVSLAAAVGLAIALGMTLLLSLKLAAGALLIASKPRRSPARQAAARRPARPVAPVAVIAPPSDPDVASALLALGFRKGEIQAAITWSARHAVMGTADTEERVRLALAYMGAGSGV